MANNPSVFGNATPTSAAVEWDDSATVHRAVNGEEGGVLAGFTVLHRGSFAEMVRLVSLLPDDKRQDYYIEKAGDRRFDIEEILDLAGRSDFPL